MSNVTDAGPAEVPGHWALPPGGTGPGVLVLHAWWGLTPTFTATADRLAAAGFVAFAPDLFGGRTATTVADAEALTGGQESAAVATSVARAVAAVAGHPAVRGAGVGVVGFSFGAAFAIEASIRNADQVAAVALYYGTAGNVDFAPARASFLGHFATRDPYEPEEAVLGLERSLARAGREFAIHRYGAGHWFVESDRPEYQPTDAELAWGRTVDFLRRRL